MEITELYLYPIKSLGGITVDRAAVTPQGFAHDRRYMLVRPDGQFLTARSQPRMLLLQPELRGDALLVSHRHHDVPPLEIHGPESEEILTVEVWGDQVQAQVVSPLADAWFSQQLGLDCRLVYMPEGDLRRVDPAYATHQEVVSFADGYPYLLIGQAALDHLNAQLETPVPMNRFRPNLVFAGGEPHAEDHWREIRIGPVTFYPVKPCARCVVTTVDTNSARSGAEPLATLSRYRSQDHKVLFGMNLLHSGVGTIQVGDKIDVLR
jgi:uncharacterized protein